MSWLCESCAHRKGELRVYHRIDSQGVERAYTNSVKVHCSESKRYPGMVKDAIKADPFMEPWQMCFGYKRRAK